MKRIRHAAVAAALTVGFMGCAEAHVFVGVGFGAPVVAAVPVAPLPVYAPPPPPVYYVPRPVYGPPVVVGYYGHPRGWYRRYYGYGYWH